MLKIIKEAGAIAGILVTVSYLVVYGAFFDVWWIRYMIISALFLFLMSRVLVKPKIAKALIGIGLGIMATAFAVQELSLAIAVLFLGFFIAYLGRIEQE